MEATTAVAATADGKGAKEATKSNGQLESFNPTTGELLGSVETVRPREIQKIVDQVGEAQKSWAAFSLEERARCMRRTAQVIVSEIEELARLLTREQGKPINESYILELFPTIDSLYWIANNGPQILAEEPIKNPQLFLKSKKNSFNFEPLGVVGIIAPWNYPWSIPFGEVAIALMAGNGVVLKPASLTCLIGQRIQETFEKGGLPKGLLRTVHGGGGVGDALVKSSAAKIFFTGSVEVGRKVGETCASLMKGSVLELGGKDPQIVLEDAHLPHAISGAVWAGFANAGQSCASIERSYVMRPVADQFIKGVIDETKKLRIGNPIEKEIEIGPMVSKEQFELVKELVDDAVANGATMHCGGPVENGMAGHFYAPTVLTDVSHEMRIMKEEIFGPVLPIVTVDSEVEAIQLANDSDFGLGASIWTSNRERGMRLAHQIQSGMVWINDHMYSHGACQCAWGGVKDSGLGRSHSKFGFYECVNIKQIGWEPSRLRDMWWHPYDSALERSVRTSTRLLYSRQGGRLKALIQGTIPTLRVARRMARDSFKRGARRHTRSTEAQAAQATGTNQRGFLLGSLRRRRDGRG